VNRQKARVPIRVALGHLEHLERVVLAARSEDEPSPPAVFSENWPHVLPGTRICDRPLRENHSDRVRAHVCVVIVTADELPDGSVLELDHHLVVPRPLDEFFRERLVDNPPTLLVDTLPNDLSRSEERRVGKECKYWC